jgi:hypothetical protein
VYFIFFYIFILAFSGSLAAAVGAANIANIFYPSSAAFQRSLFVFNDALAFSCAFAAALV